MSIKERRIYGSRFQERVYCIGILLITFMRLTQDSTLFNWNDYLVIAVKLVAALCFLFTLLVRTYTKKEFIITALLLGFAAICTVVTKIEMILFTTMLLSGLKNVDIKKVVKSIFYVSAVVVTIQVIVYAFNWFFANDTIKILLTSDYQVRHYFYFSHPNIFAGIVFGMILEWIYLYGINIKKRYQCMVITIIAIIMYVFTISRTMLMLFGILLLGILSIGLNKKWINMIISKLASYSFIIISTIIVLFLLFYNGNNKFVDKLDDIFSERISVGLIARDEYGIGLFPQYINFEQRINLRYVHKLTIDNFYMRYSLSYGIMSLVILSIILWKASKKCNTLEQLYLIIFAVWGITEGVIFDTAICIVLLIVSDRLLNSNNLNNSKKSVGIEEEGSIRKENKIYE